ncbi:MAG: Ppx/GppA family phosphatase [Alphaproteobacteria bacterium]|nr:Ppx/GppA family phosphatase [Alphaproteobacteria bacterium]
MNNSSRVFSTESDPRSDSHDDGRADDPVYGALDLGTNNCRLLLAKKLINPASPVISSFEVVDVYSRLVMLGAGLDRSNMLSREAILRCISALKVCAGKIALHRPVAVRFVATEACRQARNINSFMDQVWRETGLELEVISAAEEARLVFEACIHLADPTLPYALIFDIGGGSTEILWIEINQKRNSRLVDSISLPTGNLYRGLVDPKLAFKALDQTGFGLLRDQLLVALADFERQHQIQDRIAAGMVQMLGSSGTVTTLSAINLGLKRYDRSLVDNTRISFAELQTIIGEILLMNEADLVRHQIIGSGRSEFIVAGCAIVDALMTTWPVREIIVADRGVRDGVILKLMNQRLMTESLTIGHRTSTAPVV